MNAPPHAQPDPSAPLAAAWGRLAAWRPGGWRRRPAPLMPAARISGPMPWILAIMVALMLLAAGAALTLSSVARQTGQQIASGVTVQVVNADPAAREGEADALLAALRREPGVVAATRVPQAELETMLAPWFGQNPGAVVPVPALVELRLAGAADAATVARLQRRADALAPGALVHAEADWLGPVLRVFGSLRWLALAVVALMAGIGMAAVWLAARNALAGNADTIEVVHLLGGDDRQIAGVFERAMWRDALGGALVGALLGAAVLWLLGSQFRALGGWAPAAAPPTAGWAALALIPAGAAILAVLVTRVTVLARLRKML